MFVVVGWEERKTHLSRGRIRHKLYLDDFECIESFDEYKQYKYYDDIKKSYKFGFNLFYVL